jgi:hypothetical protein
LRVRRKRRNEGVAGDVADEVGEEVIAEFGCCLFEVVTSVSILAGLFFVPLFLLR